MTNFSKLAWLRYLPKWLKKSPVFRALDIGKKALVGKDFLPVTYKVFQKKHSGMEKDEIYFLYFIHNLRMVDFWEIPPSEYPFCLFAYFYYNRERNYREKIPAYLLEKLAKHSFGCYVGLPIEKSDLPSLAAEMGNIQFLNFLKEQRLRFNEYTLRAASSSGQLAVCKYLLDEGCKMNGYTIAAAGTVEVLEFLLNEKPRIRTSHPVTNAVKLGDMEMVTMAHRSGCKITMYAVEAAIEGDHLEVLEFLLRENPSIRTSHVVTNAVKRGDVEMVTMAHRSGCKITMYAVEAAIEGDHLEIFKYFINNGIRLNDKIKNKAYNAFLEHRKTGIVGYIRDEMQKKMHAEKPVEEPLQEEEFDDLLSPGGRL